MIATQHEWYQSLDNYCLFLQDYLFLITINVIEFIMEEFGAKACTESISARSLQNGKVDRFDFCLARNNQANMSFSFVFKYLFVSMLVKEYN